MALPLLIGMGLGYMGGAKYLMNKADERQSESMLANFQPQIPGLMGQEWNANFAAQAQQVNAPRSFGESLFAPSRTEQAQSLLNNYQDMHATAVQNQALAQQQQFENSLTYGKQLETTYNRELSDLGVMQDSFQKFVAALESNTPADILASTFNFYNMVEPGGIVRDNESGQYKDVGGTGQSIVNAMNEIIGEGLTDKTRAQLLRAGENQYMQRYNRGKTQRDNIMRQYTKYRQAGYDPSDPTGIEGIDWDYKPKYQEEGLLVPPGYTLDPNQEP